MGYRIYLHAYTLIKPLVNSTPKTSTLLLTPLHCPHCSSSFSLHSTLFTLYIFVSLSVFLSDCLSICLLAHIKLTINSTPKTSCILTPLYPPGQPSSCTSPHNPPSLLLYFFLTPSPNATHLFSLLFILLTSLPTPHQYLHSPTLPHSTPKIYMLLALLLTPFHPLHSSTSF